MNRRTTIGIASGVTLIVAAAAAVIGVNLGIMSGADAESGPGSFEPAAAVEQPAPTTTPLTTPTTLTAEPATPTTTPTTAATIPFDDTGRDHPEDGVHRSGNDDFEVFDDLDDHGGDRDDGRDDRDDDHGDDRDRGIDDDSSGHGSGSDDDD